jgi:hypothetical protein
MAAAASEFVAGHYTVTFGGVDVGTTEAGFDITYTHFREDVKVDETGDSVVTAINRGANARVTFNLSSWNQAAIDAVTWPYSGTAGTMADVGADMAASGIAKALVFTPIAGVNSYAKSYTFPLTVPDGSHGGFSLNNKLRRMAGSLFAFMRRADGVLYQHG